jgi:hypothetical protein
MDADRADCKNREYPERQDHEADTEKGCRE